MIPVPEDQDVASVPGQETIRIGDLVQFGQIEGRVVDVMLQRIDERCRHDDGGRRPRGDGTSCRLLRLAGVPDPLGDLEPGPTAIFVEAVAEMSARVVRVPMALEPPDGGLRRE